MFAEGRIWIAYLIVFLSSACTLVIELIAGRIMAPYLGVSLYTWTSIIGIVLAGMSVGNYLGGRVADRAPVPADARLDLPRGRHRQPRHPGGDGSGGRRPPPVVDLAADRLLHDGDLLPPQPGARHGVARRRQARPDGSRAHGEHGGHHLRRVDGRLDRRHVPHRLLAHLLDRDADDRLGRGRQSCGDRIGGRRLPSSAKAGWGSSP